MTARKVSIWLYYLLSLISFAFGALYFFKENMMDYHYAFMEKTQEQIMEFSPRVLQLMIYIKNLVGGCLMGIGIIAWVITRYALDRNYPKWADWGLLVTLMTANVPLLLVSYYVASQITEGKPKPPWELSLVAVVLIVVAFSTGLFAQKKENQ